jgi:hypothetical protein
MSVIVNHTCLYNIGFFNPKYPQKLTPCLLVARGHPPPVARVWSHDSREGFTWFTWEIRMIHVRDSHDSHDGFTWFTWCIYMIHMIHMSDSHDSRDIFTWFTWRIYMIHVTDSHDLCEKEYTSSWELPGDSFGQIASLSSLVWMIKISRHCVCTTKINRMGVTREPSNKNYKNISTPTWYGVKTSWKGGLTSPYRQHYTSDTYCQTECDF